MYLVYNYSMNPKCGFFAYNNDRREYDMTDFTTH